MHDLPDGKLFCLSPQTRMQLDAAVYLGVTDD